MKDGILNLLAFGFWGWMLYLFIKGVVIHNYEKEKEEKLREGK